MQELMQRLIVAEIEAKENLKNLKEEIGGLTNTRQVGQREDLQR